MKKQMLLGVVLCLSWCSLAWGSFTIVHSFPADGAQLQCAVETVPCDPVSPLVKVGTGHFYGFGAGTSGYYDVTFYDLNGSTATTLLSSNNMGVSLGDFAVSSNLNDVYYATGARLQKLHNTNGTWTFSTIATAAANNAWYSVYFDESNSILYGMGRNISTNPYTYFLWKRTLAGQYTILKTWQPVAGSVNSYHMEVDNLGNFYGTTTTTGANSCGEFWRYSPSTSTYTDLLDFPCRTGGGNMGVSYVKLDANKNAYGQSGQGGANDAGQVWKLVNTSGIYSFSTLHSFGGYDPIDNGYGDKLSIDSNGNLYGTISYSAYGDGCGWAFQIGGGGTLLAYHQFQPFHPNWEGCGGEWGPVNGGDGMYGITQYDADWTTSGAVWKIN